MTVEINAAIVDAEVRRVLGDAYDSADPRVRYDAAGPAEELAAATAQAVARAIADFRAAAAADLLEGLDGNRAALGRELGISRQRAGQLLDRAAKIRPAE